MHIDLANKYLSDIVFERLGSKYFLYHFNTIFVRISSMDKFHIE